MNNPNNNPHPRLHNLYLFLGVIVACIVIWQFIAPRLSNASPTNSSGSGGGGIPTTGCHADGGNSLGGASPLTVPDGQFVNAEWYQNGSPEHETILDPGTYSFPSDVLGTYWQYTGCSRNDVVNNVLNHIQDRKAHGANNAGRIFDISESPFQKQ